MRGELEQGGMGGVFEIPLEGWAAGNLSKRRKRKEEGIQEDGFVGSPKWTKDRGTETDVSRGAWVVTGRVVVGRSACSSWSKFLESRPRNGASGQVNMDQGILDSHVFKHGVSLCNLLDGNVLPLSVTLVQKSVNNLYI